MPAEIIERKDKEKILDSIGKEFGIEKTNCLLFRTGREKIRAFSGHLSREELSRIFNSLVVEIIGVYLLKEEKNGEFRLSLDGAHILQKKITKNIFEITDEQAEQWLKGQEIQIPPETAGFFVIKNRHDLLGCGRASGGRMINFIPKERRVR